MEAAISDWSYAGSVYRDFDLPPGREPLYLRMYPAGTNYATHRTAYYDCCCDDATPGRCTVEEAEALKDEKGPFDVMRPPRFQ